MSLPERKKQLYAIFTCIAIFGLTLGLNHPLISLILESRGVDPTLIGLMASAPAIGMLLMAPVIPYFIRKFGIKTYLLGCYFANLILFLMYPLFDNLYVWFVIRILTGAAINALMITSETWLNEIVTDENRGKTIGLFNAILAASMALGPLVIPIAGIQGWTPFLYIACFIILAIIPLLLTPSFDLDVHTKSSFSISSFFLLASIMLFAALIFSWKEIALSALLPVYGVHRGMDVAAAAVMLTAMGMGGVFLAYPVGWLADKIDRFKVMIFCGSIVGLGALLLPFVFNTKFLWPMLFFWGGSFTGLYTLAITMIGQRYRGNELVTANVALGIIWGLGALTGPSIGGVAMSTWGPQGLPTTFLVVAILFIVLAVSRRVLMTDKTKAI